MTVIRNAVGWLFLGTALAVFVAALAVVCFLGDLHEASTRRARI